MTVAVFLAAWCTPGAVIAFINWRHARREIALAARPQPLPRAEVRRG